jgi:salicylate hydroxylase
MRIAVIGTGVAGSLLLESLGDVPGFEVLGFERIPPGGHAEAGTGLNLGPNALKALRLYRPERHAALVAVSLPWRRWFIDLTDGTRLFDLDLLEVAEEPGARLRWSELYQVLRAPVLDRTHYDHALEAVEEDAAGRLVPVFRRADGALTRHGAFDLLVGGDGRYSTLRTLVAGEPVPEHFHVCLWRLLAPDATRSPLDDYGQWFNGTNRMLAYRLPGGGAYVTGAFALGPDNEITPAMKTPAYQRALYTPAAAPACAPVAWMLDQVDRMADQIHWARLQIAPMQRFGLDGRVLLLGDAAQAMVPTLGQGATQAVEDGLLAAAVLARGGDARAIAALRDPRVEFIRAFSVESTDMMLPGGEPISGAKKKLTESYRAKLRQTYTDVPSPEALAW